MRTLVESFKRLYKKGKLTKEQLVSRVEKGEITPEEYKYITGEDFPIADGEESEE